MGILPGAARRAGHPQGGQLPDVSFGLRADGDAGQGGRGVQEPGAPRDPRGPRGPDRAHRRGRAAHGPHRDHRPGDRREPGVPRRTAVGRARGGGGAGGPGADLLAERPGRHRGLDGGEARGLGPAGAPGPHRLGEPAAADLAGGPGAADGAVADVLVPGGALPLGAAPGLRGDLGLAADGDVLLRDEPARRRLDPGAGGPRHHRGLPRAAAHPAGRGPGGDGHQRDDPRPHRHPLVRRGPGLRGPGPAAAAVPEAPRGRCPRRGPRRVMSPP